jgi:hypothetical protein
VGDRNVPLNISQIKTRKAGAHADGGGLYLHVRDSGARAWPFALHRQHRTASAHGVRSIRDVPSLHVLKLHEIENGHIIEALKKIWWEQPVTANRTRERTGKLQDAAKVVAIQIFGFFASRGVIDVERTNVHFAPRAVAHK